MKRLSQWQTKSNSSIRRMALETLESRRVLAAMLQVVHNSPYAEAAVVDVYANDELLLDDFAFRAASPFVEVPSNADIKIDITAPDAVDNSSPVFTTTARFEDKTYVAMAVGDPLGREGQPAFQLAVSDIGQTSAANNANAEFLVFHGSPDAPAVDVRARGVGTLVNDVEFTGYSDGYFSVPPGEYTVDIAPAEDGSDAIVSYRADLSGAAGSALVVAASGFLAPAEGDPGFGLLAVFADGSTALLPTTDLPSARLQVIHNSPYAASRTVDVYANDALLLDNFGFREASPYIDVPAGVDIKIDITTPDAADNSSPVFSATVNLNQKTYVAVAVGDPLVTEGDVAFQLAVIDRGRESANDPEQVDVLVVHGSPDAPTVDIRERSAGTLVDDLSYPEFAAEYLAVPPAGYIIDVAPADNGSRPVASFQADLSAATGAALVVTASGFLAPSEGDPAFGLLAVFADGQTALLPAAPLPPVLGDSNGDGQFDSKDFITVMMAGKYETGDAATFEEGDWNGDGVFNSHDFIYAFTFGEYESDEHPAASSLSAADVDQVFAALD